MSSQRPSDLQQPSRFVHTNLHGTLTVTYALLQLELALLTLDLH